MSEAKEQFENSMVFMIEGFIENPSKKVIITSPDSYFTCISSLSDKNEVAYISKNGSYIRVRKLANYLPKEIEILRDNNDLKIEDISVLDKYKVELDVPGKEINNEIEDEENPSIPDIIGKTEISKAVLLSNITPSNKSIIYFLFKNNPSNKYDCETKLFRIGIFTSTKSYFLTSKSNIRRTSKYFNEKVIGIKVYDPTNFACVFLYIKDNKLYGEIIKDEFLQVDTYDSSIDKIIETINFNEDESIRE